VYLPLVQYKSIKMATDALTRTAIAYEDSGKPIDKIISEFEVIYTKINDEINKSGIDYIKMTQDEFINILGNVGITETHEYYKALLDEYDSDHLHEFENYDDGYYSDY